jgi:polyhydroxybutyrate depolymerase
VPYADGRAAIDQWLALDGCTGDPARTDYGGSHCETWSGCSAGTAVTFCTMDPMGHCWPGGSDVLCPAVIGPYNGDIDANDAMWEVFSRCTLP